MNSLKEINAMRIAKLFHGTMAVTVVEATEEVQITYISPGNIATVSKVLKNPAVLKFLETLADITNKSHEAVIADLSGNHKGLLVKVAALDSARDAIKTKLAHSNQDKKQAAKMVEEYKDTMKARADRLEALKKEVAELEG